MQGLRTLSHEVNDAGYTHPRVSSKFIDNDYFGLILLVRSLNCYMKWDLKAKLFTRVYFVIYARRIIGINISEDKRDEAEEDKLEGLD